MTALTKPVPPGAAAIPVGAYVALVDEADAERVSAHRWRPLERRAGKVYAYTIIDGKTVYLHRLILGADAGPEIDHRNRKPLDNRRHNLRPATRTQNAVNSGKMRRPDGSAPHSGFKGVTFVRGKWKPQIKVNGARPYLGIYANEIDAARAYDRAALAAWGEFAVLNFPPEVAS